MSAHPATQPTAPGRGRDSANILPAIGVSSLLMIAVSAAMVFVCTLALAFAFAASRTAEGWKTQISQSLTVRIDAALDAQPGLTEQALSVLASTPGVGEARVVSQDETRKLLEPWVSDAALLASLDVPAMIAVTPSAQPLDIESLALRLEGEVPGASLDDHGAWLAPLQAAARRAGALGMTVGAVALGALVAVILIATQAAVTSQRGIVQTLRLLGARDRFISRAFVTGMTARAVIGAALGVLVGALVLLALPSGQVAAGFFTAFRFMGLEWLAPLALLPLTGLLAYAAALAATHVVLRRID